MTSSSPFSRRQFVIGTASLGISSGRLLAAESSYPDHTVRFVNWSNAGGNLDIISRLLAEHASRRWNQAVVVDNRVGASGIIATDYVAKSAPDGYTVLITSSTGQLTNVFVRQKLPFDPVKDFEPVSLLVAGNMVLMASSSAPYNNLRELVAYATRADKPMTYGSPGIGTSAHLYGATFAKQSGVPMTHVPYKGGELGSLNDVVGGNLDLALISQGNAKSQAQGGRLKMLAISGPQRSKALPTVPTFEEQGFAGFGLAGWIAAYVPARTPPPVIAKLADTFRETLLKTDVVTLLEGLGYEIEGGSPERLRAFYADEYRRIGAMVKTAGVTAE
jgi:tripartite-type tricarboxylate transporter receptor subunit TctC